VVALGECWFTGIPLQRRRWSHSRQHGQHRALLCRNFPTQCSRSSLSNTPALRRETSPVPASARQSENVPVSYPRGFEILPSQTTLRTHLQGFYRSPLTDSNRRPPPYHAIQTATGGSQWQRFGARSSHFRPFGEPNVCQRLRPLCSITVPSQSAQNRPFERRLAEGGVTGTRPLGHFASVLGRSSGDSQVAERMRSQRSSRHHGQSNKPGEAATHPTEPYALRLRDLRRLRGSCCTGHLSGRQHPGQRESSSEQSDQHDSSGEQSGPSRDR
jgi:hypothetical protein